MRIEPATRPRRTRVFEWSTVSIALLPQLYASHCTAVARMQIKCVTFHDPQIPFVIPPNKHAIWSCMKPIPFVNSIHWSKYLPVTHQTPGYL